MATTLLHTRHLWILTALLLNINSTSTQSHGLPDGALKIEGQVQHQFLHNFVKTCPCSWKGPLHVYTRRRRIPYWILHPHIPHILHSHNSHFAFLHVKLPLYRKDKKKFNCTTRFYSFYFWVGSLKTWGLWPVPRGCAPSGSGCHWIMQCGS
jgi:hypothetical protein